MFLVGRRLHFLPFEQHLNFGDGELLLYFNSQFTFRPQQHDGASLFLAVCSTIGFGSLHLFELFILAHLSLVGFEKFVTVQMSPSSSIEHSTSQLCFLDCVHSCLGMGFCNGNIILSRKGILFHLTSVEAI
jgi:hypothetical protein